MCRVPGVWACIPAILRESIDRVQDYKTPEGKVLSRDLTAVLNTAIQFLVECRPLAITMGNAIKFLKTQVGEMKEFKEAIE